MFRSRVVRLLAELEPAPDELALALTDAAGRRMWAEVQQRENQSLDVASCRYLEELNELLALLRRAISPSRGPGA